MNARELMRHADELSGAHPGMSSHELQALFAKLTREDLEARARILRDAQGERRGARR
jgi:hypothetical protein